MSIYILTTGPILNLSLSTPITITFKMILNCYPLYQIQENL
jgi:hypothetical protein